MKGEWRFSSTLWLLIFGTVIGLLVGGLLYLASGRPRGRAIQLSPPPTPAPIQVHVSGGVLQPGVYQLPVNSRVQDAIKAAGGFQPLADIAYINLAAQVQDGEQLFIPTLAPTRQAVSILPTEASRFQAPPLPPVAEAAPAGKININTASLEALDTLPGIGPVTAQKIIDYRSTNGPFQSIEAIVDVSGIGPATFERIKELITTGAR